MKSPTLASSPSGLVVRSNVPPTSDYKEYLQDLRYDFYYSCAYCTMAESEATTINFHIDHYEPRSSRPDLENDYANLMYSCRACNTYKSDLDPPPVARQAGIRFFRPDTDRHSDHFEVSDNLLEPKSPVGDFSITHLELNRGTLARLRSLRRRLADCEDHIRSGVLGLSNYGIDRLPAEIRGKAIGVKEEVPNVRAALADDIDSILREYAASPMAAPDSESGKRAMSRSEGLAQLRGTFPVAWRGREK
jgi:uncharacterized protein (TIGR02646 family)